MSLNDRDQLPTFKYHPDPIATGAIVKQQGECLCCGEVVDYLYTGPAYCVEELCDALCPWCIADGSASEKFKAIFVDGDPLAEAGLDEHILREVTTRTPGYESWQQEVWLTHCNDACVFWGDASKETVQRISRAEQSEILERYELDAAWLADLIKHYEPRGEAAIYHFRCLHCGIDRFGMDFA
ncbi:CbrC family protein [Calycomorphotria hydatis]|uniref:CbrC family protein n=1 Tax=Calycomorphotria hydatis TaxID=2528027 RepID=A0A517TFD9_9PLAN|nr:CbrC family protein [Calycomorphotria hydatis]QDT67093.1 hypothetical protein V22_43660 [Calycomorphotria hydatis]